MKRLKIILACGVLCALVAMGTLGCEKKGPAEKAGKKMDQAFDSAKKTFKRLTDA